ncbi:hypothetical protein MLD38_005428 [Melastoma candidum]|uniref:Uncharacterized protein n=1 Tax=Melastoma candidum TaxID=119954 RepID=A0ACB9RJR5_9MYRT|nr:hypothetical protein MLD38_005428 [Melastoma candidum]
MSAATSSASRTLFYSLTLRRRPLSSFSAAASYFPSMRLDPNPPDLIGWVRKEGGFVHPSVNISRDEPPHGLGLVASQDIPKGSDLIALPDRLPLGFDVDGRDGTEANPVLVELASKVPVELWAMKLGLRLLQERAKVGSFWWTYISNLPEAYSVPIFFPGEDIKNLQYAPLLYQVNKRCRFLLEFEREVGRALSELGSRSHPFEGKDVDSSSLGWAMSAVSSRAFRLHGRKTGDSSSVDTPMMLPLIDMCNHSFSPNARIVQERGGPMPEMLVKVVAEKEIQANDPLFINYGALSNDLFLLDYGFVVPSNPYDMIELKYDGGLLDAASMAAGVTSPNFSTPATWQKEILSELKLDGESADLKVTIGGSDVVEGRLLAALRVLLETDASKVQRHELSILKSLSPEAPLGTVNELAAFRTVIALCAIALEHFPTKITDDESILRKGVPSSTELAVTFRIQKKSVIIDVMRDLSKRIKSLLSKDDVVAQG